MADNGKISHDRGNAERCGVSVSPYHQCESVVDVKKQAICLHRLLARRITDGELLHGLCPVL